MNYQAKLMLIFRCTACPKDLDGPGGRRTHALHNLLCDMIASDILWDEYGIDDDVVVSTSDLPTSTRVHH